VETLSRRPAPLTRNTYWYLTFHCNLSCRHCTVEAGPGRATDRDLGPEDIDLVVDRLVEGRAGTVLLSGGEPLTHPCWRSILQRFNRHGICWSMETNGTLIDEGFADLAAEAAGHGNLASICISLDGAGPRTHDWLRGSGSFRATLAGVQHCLRRGVVPLFQCVINARNAGEVRPYLNMMQEMGVRRVKFVFTNPVGRGHRLYEELKVDHRRRGEVIDDILAGAEDFPGQVILKTPPALIPPPQLARVQRSRVGVSSGCRFPMLGILPDGGVSICSIGRDAVTLGDVRSTPLKDLYNHPERDRLHRQHTDLCLEGICGQCAFRRRCRGNCRVWSYLVYGSFTAGFPLCQELADSGGFPEAYRLPAGSGED